MRTMASVCLLVIVLVTINDVFGNICSMDSDTMNCNECLRCGGHWCNNPASIRCSSQRDDDWCPQHDEEPVPWYSDFDDARTDIKVKPIYAERSLTIGFPNRLKISYTAEAQWQLDPIIKIANSTQTRNIEIKTQSNHCDGTECRVEIDTTANKGFCNTWGGVKEFVYVEIYVGNNTVPVVVRYHVPCACECSLENNVVKNSPNCSGHGDLSCGFCECHPEWKGEKCEIQNCPEKRGDVQCMDSSRIDVSCFGNGYCGPCDTCICYTDREGSQYFDEDNYCADLCTLTSDCDDCLLNNTIGYCDHCLHNIKLTPYNKTVSHERDSQNRLVWMKCNLTVLNCPIDYLAMRDEEDEISVMIVSSCNDKAAAGIAGAGAAGTKVPLILGVLALLALIATVAGVMVWKYMNGLPKEPLKDSQYQNIDPEDCQYQNPLYVPPTTNFNNPMYGKSQ